MSLAVGAVEHGSQVAPGCIGATALGDVDRQRRRLGPVTVRPHLPGHHMDDRPVSCCDERLPPITRHRLDVPLPSVGRSELLLIHCACPILTVSSGGPIVRAQPVDVQLQPSPTVKAVFAGDDTQSICESWL